jgi:IS5 family transposase
MLRIHFMQQWFSLSDPGMEESLYVIQSMRQFAGLTLAKGSLPDETTILNFRHLLERHQLATRKLTEINMMLSERGLLLKQGTIVDATIIAAPSSTKNKSGKRDPEMHQTQKGNNWHFGMKAHIGLDAESGLVQLKRRQAIEPIIGHLKSDNRMNRCHLKGPEGDVIHAVLCAAGYTYAGY